MFHNFIFVEGDSTTFIRWNPTSVLFGNKIRTIYEPLDGPPIIHYQDTTEALGSFVWENVPVHKSFQYNQISNLVGKSGILYTNKMPQLVGIKNLLNYSNLGNILNSDYWKIGCNGTYNLDGSCLAPDGVSLAYLYKTQYSSTYAGCFMVSDYVCDFAEHNVLSCSVKYGGAGSIGINMYNQERPLSHSTIFNFISSEILEPVISSSVTNCGVYKIPNLDGWFKIWIYYRANSEIGNRLIPYLYPNEDWVATDENGTYFTDIQLEQGVSYPTWFAKTKGTPINEPLQIEFLDMKTEYKDTPGTVKHNITLNFKLVGDYL